MSHVQRILNGLGAIRSLDADLEIEVKYLIDPRASYPGFIKVNKTEDMAIEYMKTIIDSFKNTGALFSIDETINFIERGPISTIKQLVFRDGVQLKNKKNFYTKKTLTPSIYMTGQPTSSDPPLKLSISEEKKIHETDVNASLIRSKLRLSIAPSNRFKELSKWRIDITLVKSLQQINSVSEIATVRDNLFPPNLTFDNFNAVAPWKYADSLELEIEALSGRSVSEESLAAMMSEFSSITSNSRAEAAAPSQGDSLQMKYYELAALIAPHIAQSFRPPNTRGFKSLTNNVVELTRHTFFSDLKPHIEKFLITDKADGFRVVLHLFPKEGTATIITSKHFENMEIPRSDIDECIADAEMIVARSDNLADAATQNFLVFDVMMYDGKKVSTDDFDARRLLIPKIAELSPNIFAKIFVDCADPAGDLHRTVEMVLSHPKPFPYNTDGVIFTGKMGEYSKTVNFKWKSPEDTTIDFLIKECPKLLLGIAPYNARPDQTLYLLFCGIDRDVLNRLNIQPIRKYNDIFPRDVDARKKYIPIQFSPSSNPYAYLFYGDRKDLNNKIVEMHYDVKTEKWRLHKIRDDKTRDAEHGIAYGNDFRIAELIWQNYFNPITMEDFKLTKEEGLANVYFKEHDVEAYRAMRSYNSFVKEMLYKPYQNTPWAIDLGSGKGQDLFRYVRAGIKNVLFVDLDRMALNELINRKYSFAADISSSNKFRRRGRDGRDRGQNGRDLDRGRDGRDRGRDGQDLGQSININILEADLNADYKTIVDTIKTRGYPLPSGGVDLIVCNFAIHYFVGTESMRLNFVNLIKSLIAPGGRFIFTTFDGAKVFKLISDADGKWDQMENGALKYSLHAAYQSHVFTGNGQKIKVLQPFSENEYYTEYLVDHAQLQKAFKAVGMTREIFESFDIYQNTFKERSRTVYDQLTELDKLYSSLYTINSYHLPR